MRRGQQCWGRWEFCSAALNTTTPTQLTIAAAPPLTTTAAPTTTGAPATTAAGTTTAGPTTTVAATTTTPAPGTTQAAKPTAPANGIPAFLQIDGEIMAVTAVDASGMVVSVTRTAPVTHAANAPVFAPVVFFANGVSGVFQNGTTPLPAVIPPGLYVLTMQVTARHGGRIARGLRRIGLRSNASLLSRHGAGEPLRRATSTRCKTRSRSPSAQTSPPPLRCSRRCFPTGAGPARAPRRPTP